MPLSPFYKQTGLHLSNIYEVNLRQYTKEGSFSAFAKHLPRLKEMGVEILWFMPLTPIALKNRKGSLGSYYACSHYTAINPEFGTLEDCKRLFEQAHDMGFSVIIDWVANHTGWDHHWTLEHPDYYVKDAATGDFKMASGMDDIIELDYEHPELRSAMIDAMLFWVEELQVDGFRCDLAFWVRLDFWLQARVALQKTKTLFWFGEFDPLERPEYLQAFDAAYTWTWMHKTEEFCKGNTGFRTLLDVLDQYGTLYGDNSIPVWFTSNHDENSWNGTEYEKYGPYAKLLSVFSFTWPGMPMIYGGQELPVERRLAFFEKDPLIWDAGIHLHDFYRSLMNLRKENPALSGFLYTGFLRLNTPQDERVLAFSRIHEGEEVIVLLNFSDTVVALQINGKGNHYCELFSGDLLVLSVDAQMVLPPYGYQVWEKRA